MMVEPLHPQSKWKDVSIANRQRTPVQALFYSPINYSDLNAVNMLNGEHGGHKARGIENVVYAYKEILSNHKRE